jgi:hypothetical protein
VRAIAFRAEGVATGANALPDLVSGFRLLRHLRCACFRRTHNKRARDRGAGQ